MNWSEIKAVLTAMLESVAQVFEQHNEPELRPIPVEQKRAPQPRDQRY